MIVLFFVGWLITSNIAFKSSSRKRNGIFDTCKRFCVEFELFVDEDVEPFGVIVLVDCGEWDDDEFDWHTLSFGDNDCVIWLLLFDDEGDDGKLTFSVKFDVESTTRFGILFVVVILIDAYKWSWLGIVASDDESTPFDDDRLIFGGEGDAVVNNVGIKG